MICKDVANPSVVEGDEVAPTDGGGSRFAAATVRVVGRDVHPVFPIRFSRTGIRRLRCLLGPMGSADTVCCYLEIGWLRSAYEILPGFRASV